MASRKKITYSERPNHAARSAHARGERQFKTYDTSHIRPQKSKAPLILGIVLAVVMLIVAFFVVSSLMRSCSVGLLPEGETVEITIPEGSGAQAIGSLLQENRVIANSGEFVTRVNELGVAAELKPGNYTFHGAMTVDEVISQLRNGPDLADNTFTIPEGFTKEAVAQRVSEAFDGSISYDDFIACVNNASAYSEEFPFVEGAYDNSLEGFLFPKTYPITSGATADSIVKMMLAQYQAEVEVLDYSYAESLGLTRYQVLILASIIEKEASSENRGIVSSVFYNRLAAEMPLQSDATTAYVVGRDPTAEDIENDYSPYSTYHNPGLPGGPICSPGIACLEAACHPDITNYYYFYFKEENGELVYSFSETNEEHNEAIFS